MNRTDSQASTTVEVESNRSSKLRVGRSSGVVRRGTKEIITDLNVTRRNQKALKGDMTRDCGVSKRSDRFKTLYRNATLNK